MRIRRLSAACGLLVLLFGITACEQQDGLTREQGDQILEQLKAMNAKLDEMAKAQEKKKPKPKSTRVKMELNGGFRMGKADAPVVLVEFFDYQCPFCKRFADQTFPQLKKEYIDTGKLLYVAQDLPLDFHKQAKDAANAAHCAGDQDQFWAYRDMLLANMKQLQREHLISYAKTLGLKEQPFLGCLDSNKYAQDIDRSKGLASTLGLTGTPSFVIAKNTGKTLDGNKLVGAKPYKVFADRINQLLN